MPRHEIALPGCRVVPLAHYLKSLAVLRLVAQQVDPSARGRFDGDTFVLTSEIGRSGLMRFFLEEYRPSAVISPWNGGSGFYQKGNRDALIAIRDAKGERFRPYAQVIRTGERVLASRGISRKPTKDEKEDLLTACRAALPPAALEWLDASLVLTADGPKYPPLLGTGGNDGRLDFTYNFMQRLLDLLDTATGAPLPGARATLAGALFEEAVDTGSHKAIGQFFPGSAGGPNATTGFEGDAAINPWDFVLMIEGTLVFSTAAVRRMEADRHDALAYPFTVCAAPVGYGNAADSEGQSSRGEIWLPVWRRAAGFPEVKALFSEGRARVGRRPARDGVDFARAVATLGVDRGVSEFQRYGFHLRNGLAFFATPLSRHAVQRNEGAHLVDEIDSWLQAVRRRLSSAPSSVATAHRETERAIMNLCRQDTSDTVQRLLVCLGAFQASLAASRAFTEKARIQPVPLLSGKWLTAADDGAVEFRLAAALAGGGGVFGDRFFPMRRHVDPVEPHGKGTGRRVVWRKETGREVVSRSGSLVTWLNRILARRIILATGEGTDSWSDSSRSPAGIRDLASFLDARTDDRRLGDLFQGLLLVDWYDVAGDRAPTAGKRHRPDALFALLKLCFAGREVRGIRVPLHGAIQAKAGAGDGARAAELAVRRLRGSGLPPLVRSIARTGESVLRTSAALLFPLGSYEIESLADRILGPRVESEETAETGGESES